MKVQEGPNADSIFVLSSPSISGHLELAGVIVEVEKDVLRMQNTADDEVYQLSKGQYFQVHRGVDSTSVVWPSLKPVIELIDDLKSSAHVQEQSRAVVGIGSRQFGEILSTKRMPLGALERKLHKHLLNAALVEVDFGEFIFHWTRDSRMFEVDGEEYPEVALIYRGRPEVKAEYVEQTATPEVSARARDFLSSSAILNP